jgi:hypothetical protein
MPEGRGAASPARVEADLHREDDGQVVVVVALFMVGLLFLLALVLDLGVFYDTDSGLQKAADLSAVAGAQYLATNGSLTGTTGYPCAGSLTATSCALTVAGLNGITSPETVSATQITYEGNPAIQVIAQHPNASGMLIDSTRTASATAVVGGLSGATNYFPATFTCPPPVLAGQCTATNFPTPPATYTFTFSDTPAPGNFDLLASCAGGSDAAIAQCINCAQTYQWPSMTPNPYPSGCSSSILCTGASAAGAPGQKYHGDKIDQALIGLEGEVVLVPIWTSVDQSGANAVYTIGGFAALLITNWDKKNAQLTGTFEGFLAPGSVEGSCTGSGSGFGTQTYYLAA